MTKSERLRQLPFALTIVGPKEHEACNAEIVRLRRMVARLFVASDTLDSVTRAYDYPTHKKARKAFENVWRELCAIRGTSSIRNAK